MVTTSFFAGNEPVIQKVQSDELMDAYDMEVSLQKALGSFWRRGYISSSLAFVHTAPLKVLAILGRSFFGKLWDNGWINAETSGYDKAVSQKRAVFDIEPSIMEVPENSPISGHQKKGNLKKAKAQYRQGSPTVQG